MGPKATQLKHNSLCDAGVTKPKAKAKGKAKAKSKSENPVATWDLKKTKASQLDKAFPVVDRKETKKLVEKEVLQKARFFVSAHWDFWRGVDRVVCSA